LKIKAVVNGMKITDKSEIQHDACIMGKMTQSFNRQSDERATERSEKSKKIIVRMHCTELKEFLKDLLFSEDIQAKFEG
jgi:hypothetical protein